MKIASLQKISLLDYPGHISAIIFTQGCNFRCRFCYNPMLVWPTTEVEEDAGEVKYEKAEKGQRGRLQTSSGYPQLAEDGLFEFLKSRIGKLDAVVITGGEPTIHPDLAGFLKKIKKLGFKIKLDTNGTNPESISDLIGKNLLDYIAMDIKASPEKYFLAVGREIDFKKIKKSVKIIMQSELAYEFRTTVAPDIFEEQEIDKIGEIIRGADKWFLQNFKSNIDLVDQKMQNKRSFTEKEMLAMKKKARNYVFEVGIR